MGKRTDSQNAENLTDIKLEVIILSTKINLFDSIELFIKAKLSLPTQFLKIFYKVVTELER